MKRYQHLLRALALALLLLLGGVAATPAAAQAKISKLSDVDFGTLTSFASDAVRAQSICVYSTGLLGLYHVTATGSGAGGAFTLATGGGATLPYEVQWNAASGQTSGTSMTSGTALTGQLALGTLSPDCTVLSNPTTASLIVVLHAASLPAATAGSYSGTLTIIIAPS